MQELDENLALRMELASDRISEIEKEIWNMEAMDEATRNTFTEVKRYFESVAGFLMFTYDVLLVKDIPGNFDSLSLEQLKSVNDILYEDILAENYSSSFANPDYAVEKLGEYGKLMSALYAELRSEIVYAYENEPGLYTANLELFVEMYSLWSFACEDKKAPALKEMRDIYYYHMYDYADVLVSRRTLEIIDSDSGKFAMDIIMNSDLSDLRYLYRYGEYIGENEIKTAEYMNTLDEEKICAMAATYVNGFVDGFKTMRIDIKPKKTVNIRFAIGQERMIREAVKLFEKHGLKAVITRYAISRINRKLTIRSGFTGSAANKQYEYDHRMDEGIFYDKAFAERKLEVISDTYDKHAKMAAAFAGPAVIETFGENPFEPVIKENAITLTTKQKELSVLYAQKTADVSNKYMPRDNYSFTIIAYPMPEIGNQFEDIFAETVKINTLDSKLYSNIQQSIIEELDCAKYVQVIGKGKNKTDMKVMLHSIDKATQTNFENCVADVNIPVGEVFTSPVLTGTEGVLNVSSVYLNELNYKNLTLEFKDGRIENYSCDNFEDEEKNKDFIKENLMFNHDTLPIGEFAIGTNTKAYVMAHKYDILYKLPILIVEKTGPHFAVGDTCYSYSEEARLYNPDGREIVAKENECSMLRNSEQEEERAKAYYNCHTDITIPYEEIGGIYSVHEDGTKVAIIENGRFVLPGTQVLNEAFDE